MVSAALSDETFAVHQSRDLSLTRTTLAILYAQMCPDPRPRPFLRFGTLFEAFIVTSRTLVKPALIRHHESTLAALDQTRLFLS